MSCPRSDSERGQEPLTRPIGGNETPPSVSPAASSEHHSVVVHTRAGIEARADAVALDLGVDRKDAFKMLDCGQLRGTVAEMRLAPLRFLLDTDTETDGDASSDTADFLVVVQRLRDTLGERRGRIRVSDVQELAGLERPSYYRMNLIARALRHLGWRRTRCRFGGTLAYGYSRGTRLQREDILEIERREDGQVTLKEVP